MQLDDKEMMNTIYAVNGETTSSYLSEAYYLQSYVCKEILNNRTFISTLENLRLKWEIYDVEKWFDDITGERDSYRQLNEASHKIIRIVNKFNSGVNFR